MAEGPKMPDGTQEITADAFDAFVVRHGSDPVAWPTDAAMHAFAATEEGSAMLAGHQAMDRAFAAEGDMGAADGADFLAALKAIPDAHRQASAAAAEAVAAAPQGLMDRLFDRLIGQGRLWSPLGFAAQGAAVALVLMLGVFVGMQGGPTGDYDEYDISAGLFEADEDGGFSLDG